MKTPLGRTKCTRGDCTEEKEYLNFFRNCVHFVNMTRLRLQKCPKIWESLCLFLHKVDGGYGDNMTDEGSNHTTLVIRQGIIRVRLWSKQEVGPCTHARHWTQRANHGLRTLITRKILRSKDAQCYTVESSQIRTWTQFSIGNSNQRLDTY